MNLYRIHHVIGKDNLHRIRVTSVANGQNVGNSGEGFNDKQEAIENAGRCFRAYLEVLGLPDFLFLTMQNMLRVTLADIPTVDERVRKMGINRRSQCCNADADDLGDGEHFQCQKCRRGCSTTTLDERVQTDPPDEWNDCRDSKPQYRVPEADPLRRERVFGKPADPFEPQTQTPEN